MKVITAYRTQDGKLFESQELAKEHEFGQLLTDRLDKFSKQEDCPFPYGDENSLMRKSIIAWEHAKQSIERMVSIDTLQLTVRTSNCLKADGIYTIADLTQHTENDLFKTPNMGRKSLDEVIDALKQRNLTLASI